MLPVEDPGALAAPQPALQCDLLRLQLVAGGGRAVAEESPALLEVGAAGVGVAGGDGLAVDGVVLVVRVLGVSHVAHADLQERVQQSHFKSVPHLVAEHCLLTSNSKFRHSINFFTKTQLLI